MDEMILSDRGYEAKFLATLERIATGIERTNQLLEVNGRQNLKVSLNGKYGSYTDPVIIRQAVKA